MFNRKLLLDAEKLDLKEIIIFYFNCSPFVSSNFPALFNVNMMQKFC